VDWLAHTIDYFTPLVVEQNPWSILGLVASLLALAAAAYFMSPVRKGEDSAIWVLKDDGSVQTEISSSGDVKARQSEILREPTVVGATAYENVRVIR
jgi:hypothetical protein